MNEEKKTMFPFARLSQQKQQLRKIETFMEFNRV